ncbi:type III pantothenate kinase [Odoribacter sp. OttesenSCG-928-J03]|nr:type III pantothenate kinase [Odoribacter sp. OttesenSCG-928-J03]MDL2330686.1 type III pantothenate kinase [Odoribacter sp. OttesenSCG-928-A06]
MNLVIDIGNTRLKYGFFEKGELRSSGCDVHELEKKLECLKKGEQEIDILISGSGKIDQRLQELLKSKARLYFYADHALKLPININYQTPETLGFDRIANAVGGNGLFPGRELLIVDAGTAITYDFVDASNSFIGGNISPGYAIRFKSLHEHTDKLPLLKADAEYDFCGRNTREAIVNGVMNGIFFEVKEYIDRFIETHENGKIILTGGDSLYIHNRLSSNALLQKDLGIIGLNLIIEHNKTTKT